jgi:UDP-glucose 4-epimerase
VRVLITGGAGFIGSHLTDRLLESGHDVLVIDNFATGRRDNLRTHEHLAVVEGSIADEQLVRDSFAQFVPDRVVHAAAAYKNPEAYSEDARTNVLGTANVVNAAREGGVEQLIYFQTALCYGLAPRQQPVSLDHPLDPEASSYAISKTAGEYYIRLSGLNYLSFRLANAYGPRNISGPLPTFYQRLTTGRPCFVMDTRRDFIFIDDLVELVLSAVTGDIGRTGVYHVSSGSDYSIRELFDATVDALGIALPAEVEVRPRNPDDAYTILLDPRQTEQDFGWSAHTPLAEGVRRTIEYYHAYGISKTFTHLKLAEAAS